MPKETIQFEDFQKIDIRIGTIVAVSNFPEAKVPAYKLTIDFGSLGLKKSSAQITELYKKEELLNKQILAILNFKAKQTANFMSECLVLGIQNGTEVVLLQAREKVKNGEKVS